MNRVKIVTLLVNDQDEALQFYVQKLGFKLIEDMSFGASRWITIALPNHADVSLALERATAPEDRAVVGKQAGSASFSPSIRRIALATTNA